MPAHGEIGAWKSTARVFFGRLLALLICLAICPVDYARTLYVDSIRGDDRHDGLSFNQSFRTIQQAADLVVPGDEVLILPGIYFERVSLKRKGKQGLPIIFRADSIEKNRVIVTGAKRDLRLGRDAWKLEDGRLGVYSTPYSKEAPARVLYSGTDLFPYASLEQLKTYTTDFGPAPQHGHFYDEKGGRLYVRLHSSGQYGSTDPNRHAMAVSPHDGHGISILGRGASHVALLGLTFETPGNSAVLVEGDFVEVQSCWFVGCPYGVRGTRRSQADNDGVDDSASHVTIAYCDFNEFPAFDDAEELLKLAKVSRDKRGTWVEIWHRKTSGQRGLPAGRQNYENGMAAHIGDHWDIHHNDIHDGFEGLANDGLNWATNLQVHENLMTRLCDNAIEVENHAQNVSIYRNVMRDVFEPFSYQPLVGPPWPGPIRFFQNLIINTPKHAEVWRYAIPEGNRGAFKLGISRKNWDEGYCPELPRSPLAVPAPGLLIENNTVIFLGGRLISLLGDHFVPVQNVRFNRNIFVSDIPIAANSSGGLEPGHFEFRQNISVAPRGKDAAAESQLTAGDQGRSVEDIATLSRALRELELSEYENGVESNSKPRGTFGAIHPEEKWLPLKVGPTKRVDQTTPQSVYEKIAE